MFGRKKVHKDDEPLTDWESLLDLLIGVGGGKTQKDGSVRFEVRFKKEKRKAEVFVHCAEVSPIGEVLYFTAPFAYPASPENCAQALELVEKILEGGLVVSADSLAVRTTKPMKHLTYRDVARLVGRVAVTADEFAKKFPAD